MQNVTFLAPLTLKFRNKIIVGGNQRVMIITILFKGGVDVRNTRKQEFLNTLDCMLQNVCNSMLCCVCNAEIC